MYASVRQQLERAIRTCFVFDISVARGNVVRSHPNMSDARFAKLQERYEVLSARLLDETPEMRTSTGSFLKGGVPKKKSRPKSALDVQARANKSDDEHAKRLRLIHDHMWQHRQEGRDMKRAELDMKKTQLQLRRAIQLREQEAEKKQKEEERALQEKQLALAKYEQQDLHARKSFTESKIHRLRV